MKILALIFLLGAAAYYGAIFLAHFLSAYSAAIFRP
jgi:hypothetical protein